MSDPSSSEKKSTPANDPAIKSASQTTATVERKRRSLRLRLEPVSRRAMQIAEMVERDMPHHQGLGLAAAGVVDAAASAKEASRTLRRPWGAHRLPVVFLAVALLAFFVWIYWRFWRVTELTIALPERDAIALHEKITRRSRVRLKERPTRGSRESAALIARGEVDLAFMQGGVEIEPHWLRLKTSNPELVLFFLREGVSGPSQVRTLMTSAAGQGSHSVAQHFTAAWGVSHQVRYVHDWRTMTDNPRYQIPQEIDAVFVVKDPGNTEALSAITRLADAGFRLASADLGARALKLEYLTPHEIPRGYLRSDPAVPQENTKSYAVSTYLVARDGLTPRLLAEAGRVVRLQPSLITDRSFEPTVGDTSEVLQGIEAFLGIVVYIGVAFLTLLGLEMLAYRRRFNELNSLVSLISMHQSDKDVLGVTDQSLRSNNLRYLSLCSDLLGLISVIAGYYSQENISLLHNNLLQTIHERCSGLKINIQLKILHAAVEVQLPDDGSREI